MKADAPKTGAAFVVGGYLFAGSVNSLCLFMLDMLWSPFWLVIKTIFIPLIISIFISYLLLPVTEWLHGKGLPRTLSILVIYVLFLAGLAGRCIKGCLF
ncbi:hypothetical protein CXF51_15575 [Bacillus subtilis subsp. subtilis]|nr:hypothetical protein CXF51_15575 [Bacillus subtilis subsp. subtilis]